MILDEIQYQPGYLLSRVNHKMRHGANQMLSAIKYPLTMEEATILWLVAGLPAPERMGPLSEKLGRDATTLKRQLDGLVKNGLVERKPCPKDSRAVIISITNLGNKTVSELVPILTAWREKVMGGISEKDQELLTEILIKMLNNLKK